MDLISEAEEFLRNPGGATDGAGLADGLYWKAVGLCHNKATEFSPDIEKLFLLSAKVALLTFGPRAIELQPFEREVYYYKAFTPPSTVVAEYDDFKGSL